ncbi:unnamed protein product [Oikopleura dioica]|uniref:Uncharacterized protein n=1 Tax=Oikopleura dioica TaxID=34765 RepID=E4X7M3_OIKDI|nr:unnamed protein product [Oikopleura dioica]
MRIWIPAPIYSYDYHVPKDRTIVESQ